MSPTYDYDVALSFAGEDRQTASELARLLRDAGVKVFYDEFEQEDIWGKDLYQHLQAIYRDMARYCIILISRHYAAKTWTSHELKQAQARALTENREYLLPVRLDDSEIPGLNDTIAYIDLRKISLGKLVGLALRKLGLEPHGKSSLITNSNQGGGHKHQAASSFRQVANPEAELGTSSGYRLRPAVVAQAKALSGKYRLADLWKVLPRLVELNAWMVVHISQSHVRFAQLDVQDYGILVTNNFVDPRMADRWETARENLSLPVYWLSQEDNNWYFLLDGDWATVRVQLIRILSMVFEIGEDSRLKVDIFD